MNELEFTDQFQQFKVEIKGVRLPSFIVPDLKKKELGITKDISNYEFLVKLTENGLLKGKSFGKAASSISFIIFLQLFNN